MGLKISKEVLAALDILPDIQEAMAIKQAEIQALATLEEVMTFEQSIDMSGGIPSAEVLAQMVSNKTRQIAAYDTLLKGLDPETPADTVELKEADYGTNIEKSLTAPIDQAAVVAKDSDPGHQAFWKNLVKKAWGDLSSLRNGKPPAAGGVQNYEAAFQNIAQRLRNPEGAEPKDMNSLRLFLSSFPDLYKTDQRLADFGRKTFAQKEPSKFEAAKNTMVEFANIIDLAGEVDRWKGPSFEKFVSTLEGYVRKFETAYNTL